MPKPEQLKRLIKAAVAYSELAERHLAAEDWKTKTLQAAANFARAGNTFMARQKEIEVRMRAVEVFDFTDVKLELIRATKPFRRRKKCQSKM